MANISLRQLQAVRAIHRSGKIINAAKSLGLTGPAVTIQLKLLEQELGVSLFDRTSEGMRLTAAGATVLSAADSIEGTLRSMGEAINSQKGLRSGTLRLGVVSTAKYFAPRMISAFLAVHEKIDVQLTVGNRQETIDSLRRYNVDLALMGRPPRDIPVRSMVFGDHPLVIIAPPGHRLAGLHDISREIVAREKFIVRETGSGTRSSTDFFFASVPERQESPSIVMDSNETIKQAVIAGLGIAFISAHTIEQELQIGKLVILDVAGMPIRRQWFSVARSDREETPVMSAFNDFLKRQGPVHLPMINKIYPAQGGA